jgi:DNA-binding SARP family transcriptional activator/tetratricopeptide (TPR) repeat protein
LQAWNELWTSEHVREHYNRSTEPEERVDDWLRPPPYGERIHLPECSMGLPCSIRCLGRPALLDGFGAPIRLRTQKQLALLVYLALEGRTPVRRDRLADLLWPGVAIREGRHSMACAISALRNRVDPEGFPGDNQSVRMTAELRIDLERLERGDVLATDLLPSLEVDAFLEDFEIPDAPAFNHWRDQQRARLWPAIEDALVRQMDHCRRTGNFTGIVVLADRTLLHNPLSEAAVRARIEARAFAGDRLGALRAFETWKHTLQTELEAQPSEKLEAMARRLRRGTLEGGGDGARPRVPTEQWKDRTFVGRAAEYRTLYEAWERTTRGEPTHALVLGESGIGKSTLIQRLLTAASLDGAVTSRVQCYELERDIPYAALGALVRGLLERPEARATSPGALADLAQVVPAVHEHFPHLPPAIQLHGESFRIRITDAMETLLRAIAEETPVILVVDDLHLADDASVAVVHLLVRRFERERVMLALAARPSGPSESPNIAKLRESHRRLGVVSLEVPPMADDEAAAMLDSLTVDGPKPGKTERDAMLRAAGGYPMALDLFVSEWIASGEGSLALAVPAMREELGHRPPPEDAYRLALDRIHESLDPSARLVLQLAAVLGPRLNDLTMYQTVDLGLGTTGQAMSALRSMRLLRETEERLEFVNELIRGHTYLSIPKPMRTALHGEVVTRLLAAEAAGCNAPGLEIAWHLIRAGRRDEAAPYLLRGARESMRGGAPHEAERGLATAMDRLEEPDRSEALLLLGEALQEQGRMEESVEFLDQVSDSARSVLLSRRNVLRLYACHFINENTAQAELTIALGLLAESRSAQEANTRLRALWMAASVYRDLREPTLLREILSQLTKEGSNELSLEDKGEHALGMAFCFYHSGDKSRSREIINGIIGNLEAQGILNSVYLRLVVGLAASHSGLGDYVSAVSIAEKGIQVARKLGEEKRLRMLAANLSLSHSRLGNTDAQLHWAEFCATGRPDTTDDQFHHFQVHYLRAHAYALQGREAEAMAALEDGSRTHARFVPPYLQQAWCVRKADILLLLGRGMEALRSAREAVTGDMRELCSDSFAGPYSRWLARTTIADKRNPGEVGDSLAKLLKRGRGLDCIDHAEVLNAKVWLDCRTGVVDEQERAEMWRRLGDLPAAATIELRRLGMLEI